MTLEQLLDMIRIGETPTVEFKRCGNQPGADAFETICAFCNRNGGNLLLGVLDDGSIEGIAPDALAPIVRNLVNVTNNPNVFSPPTTLEFEEIDCNGKAVLRVWVPASPAVHSYKSTVFDRKGDADIAVRFEAQISLLYLNKQNFYTEQRVYRYLTKGELRLDKLDELRKRASIKRRDHPWKTMDDDELLTSMQLYGRDYDTGEEGLTLAAGLLLGRDDVISSLCPAYKTDAFVRIDDLDRYDDRITVCTNLIDAYDQLAVFCRNHLPDRFHLEGDQAVSPRDVIVRELVSNMLMHREFSSPFPAKLIITRDAFKTENASRALFQGTFTPENFNPMPKNPRIAKFFNQIGLAEEMGAGTRNLFKYTKAYSGSTPTLEEGDVFKASIPLRLPAIDSENISGHKYIRVDLPAEPNRNRGKSSATRRSAIEYAVVSMAKECGFAVAADIALTTGEAPRTVQRTLASMVDSGILRAEGNTRAKRYYLMDKGA